MNEVRFLSTVHVEITLQISLHREREQKPRFAQTGSFEFDFCQKWKELYRMEEEQRKQLERQMEEACLKVEMEMEQAAHEYQAMLLRQGNTKTSFDVLFSIKVWMECFPSVDGNILTVKTFHVYSFTRSAEKAGRATEARRAAQAGIAEKN